MREESLAFWQKQPANGTSMLLLHRAEPLEGEDLREILSYLPPLQGKEVLDLAAGIGRFTTPFAQVAKRVIAVDFCDHFTEKNRERNRAFSNIDYLTSDARTLSFPPQSLDFIFISWLFLYLEDHEVEALIQQLFVWLRPGGHLFLRESCRPKRETSEKEGYAAIYRSVADYTQFFPTPWRLVDQGNSLAYEHHRFDPFKWYWLYEKPS